jgi:hypothetical protein
MSTWNVELLVQDCSSLLGHQDFFEGVTTPTGPQAASVRLGPRAFGQAPSCLVTPHGAVPDSHRLFLGVALSWGDLPCPSGEGSSPCHKGLPCHGGDHAGCVLKGKIP